MEVRKQNTISFLLVIGILALVAINSWLFFFRVDLTSAQVHTLSNTSEQLLSEARGPISLTYYLSPKIKEADPSLQDVQGVEDFLLAYANSISNVDLKIMNPDDVMEESGTSMQALGIEPRQMNIVERSEYIQAQVYSGITIDYQGETEIIPFLANTTTLEYDLTSRIVGMITQSRPVIGFLSGDNERVFEEQFKAMNQIISDVYTLRVLEASTPIPFDVDAVIVAGSVDLTSNDAFYLDQFIMGGGKVLFALDGMAVDLEGTSGLPALPLEANPILDLVASYGITVRTEFLLDTVSKNLFTGRSIEPYPLMLRIVGPNTNPDNLITQRFAGLDLYWASALSVEEKEGITTEVIASTSEEAWLAPNLVSLEPQQASVSQFTAEERGQFPVAAVASGAFTSAFPQGAPGELSFTEEPLTQGSDSRIIVVGDSDFLLDQWVYEYWRQIPGLPGIQDSVNNMLYFTPTALEWLIQRDELLEIKNRPFREQSLTGLTEDNVESADFWLKLVNVFLIPLGILIFGSVYYAIRRLKQKAIR